MPAEELPETVDLCAQVGKGVVYLRLAQAGGEREGIEGHVQGYGDV